MALATVTNLDIGPCTVNFDGVDLGGTLENATITFKYDKADMKADQYGTSLLDQAVSGMEVTIETSLAETRDKDKLAKVFPNATMVGTSPDALAFNDKVATRMEPLSGILILHPIVEGAATNENFDYYFYKAVPTEESSYVFSPTDQGKMKIVWRVLLDTSTDPARIFRYGDKDLT